MSFRQFGGLQFGSKHNAVASYYNTSKNLIVTKNVGQPNSYINFLSDISGNQIFGNVDISGNLNVSGDIDCSGNFQVISESSNDKPSVIITKNPGSSATFGTQYGWQHQGQLQIQNTLIPSPNTMVLAMSNDGVGIIQGATNSAPYNNICLNPIAGNVGIGTYAPGFTLDVIGNLRTTMDASINSITVGRGGGNIGTNTVVSVNALQANTSGFENTAVGYQALLKNTTGSYNTAIGVQALEQNTDGSYNTAVGNGALMFNYGSYNTGVGTITTGGTIGNYGSYNSFLGFNAGAGVSVNPTNSTAIGNGATILADNDIVLGNNLIATLRCQQTNVTGLSDARDKKDIEPLTNGITFVDQLKPVKFVWNMRDKGKVDIPAMGFIAQDLQQVQKDTGITVPGLVYDVNPDRLEASYGTLLPVLVKSVQELSAEVKALKIELNELKNK